MAETLVFPKGSVIVLTSGEYSDFGIVAYLVAIQRVDLPALAEKFKIEFVPERAHDTPSPHNFPGWLIAQGHCMPVDHSEVHIGSHGSLEVGA